jgi:arylsulfatase A-like enzyme
VIRPPRDHRPSVAAVDAQAAEIDVPATIIDLAGAAACRGDRCRTLDGRSLLPALRGRTGALERRAVLIEMQDTSRDTRSTACAFRAVRTTEAVLIESSAVPDPVTGRCEDGLVYESYDLRSDPFQLENLVPPPGSSAGAERSELTSRLDGLRSCSGIAGRDPRSPGGYCE